MTNELIEETPIQSGIKYVIEKLYSKKQLKYVMSKKDQIAYRFVYTPITEQDIKSRNNRNKADSLLIKSTDYKRF